MGLRMVRGPRAPLLLHVWRPARPSRGHAPASLGQQRAVGSLGSSLLMPHRPGQYPNARVSCIADCTASPAIDEARTRYSVLQDDVLYETLTVYETLLYSGLLRLPRGMPGEEKRRRVEAVVAGLGLRRSRDTIIGGFFRRGISGA